MIRPVEVALAGGQARGRVVGLALPSLCFCVRVDVSAARRRQECTRGWTQPAPPAPALLPGGQGPVTRSLCGGHGIACLPQGSQPRSAPAAPCSRLASLLPWFQCHRLGDQDAATTACLPSRRLWASQLPPIHTDLKPRGPGSRQGRLGLSLACLSQA